jgi:hypothetical protein
MIFKFGSPPTLLFIVHRDDDATSHTIVILPTKDVVLEAQFLSVAPSFVVETPLLSH